MENQDNIVRVRKVSFFKNTDTKGKTDLESKQQSLPATKINQNFKRFKTRANPLHRLGFIGDWLVKRRIKKGDILAEITFPSGSSIDYVVSTREDWTEVSESGEVRFFDLSIAKSAPSMYIRHKNFIPTIQFYWDCPTPIPIKPTGDQVIDMDTFSTLILKQRTKSAIQPIKEFLDHVVKDFGMMKIATLVSAVCSAYLVAKSFGIL